MRSEQTSRPPSATAHGRHRKSVGGRPAGGSRGVGTLNDFVLELQRTAGNRAVASHLGAVSPTGEAIGTAAPVQREDNAPAAEVGAAEAPDSDPLKMLSEMWDSQLMDRLAAATKSLRGEVNAEFDATHAELMVRRSVIFVRRAYEAVPRDSPLSLKLRILGQSLYGVQALIEDRRDKGGDRNTSLIDDLRFWRSEAANLGPQLTNAPGKATQPDQTERVKRWHDGVVVPLGATMVQTERDLSVALSQASLALEVINMWRQAAPKGDTKLRLIALERGVYYSLQRLQQRVSGSGGVDLVRDLETIQAEAAVIGPQLAVAGAGSQAPEAAPAAAP